MTDSKRASKYLLTSLKQNATTSSISNNQQKWLSSGDVPRQGQECKSQLIQPERFLFVSTRHVSRIWSIRIDTYHSETATEEEVQRAVRRKDHAQLLLSNVDRMQST